MGERSGKHDDKRRPIWSAPAPDATPEQCPCCGQWTLHSRGDYEICASCYGEDDCADEVYGQPAPERPIGPNRYHLWKAREHVLTIGFSDERYVEEERQAAPCRASFSFKPREPTE